MKKLLSLLLLVVLLTPAITARAQEDWPRAITAGDGSIIHVFLPQPDSLFDNNIRFRAAFSLAKRDSDRLIYGSFSATAEFQSDRNSRTLTLLNASLLRLDCASPMSPADAGWLRTTLESGLPSVGEDIPIDRLIAFLDTFPQPRDPSPDLSHSPPRVLVSSRPAKLIFIDGIPRPAWNRNYSLYVFGNTPYTILQSGDGWYYCYGGRHWYIAPMPEGPWTFSSYTASDLNAVTKQVDAINNRQEEHPDTLREGNAGIVDVLFSAAPAELIQTRGAPLFTPVHDTRLLYAVNSDEDLFLDSTQKRYYILLAGRWFGGPTIHGPWRFVSQDSLPPDFAAIPEGSPADHVLACIAGTPAAREALIDNAIPQTAFIPRTATTSVSYDGIPQFQPVHGTHLQYAVNTASVVIKTYNAFYCVDKGVWFTSRSTTGPWKPSTTRPEEISRIPPDCPIYYCKYVYIYGADSDYILTGYTGGYLGSYVDGSTLVYGTGYYYPFWAGNNIYPHAWTYGFNIWYNPWYGWSLGYSCSPDWLNTAVAWGQGSWTGGWYGPPAYRPPYIWHHFSGHGFYSKDYRLTAGISYNNNLYTLTQSLSGRRPPERLVTDTSGRVFCPNPENGWLVRVGDTWTPVGSNDKPTLACLGKIMARLQRGEMRIRNFRQANGGISSNAGIPNIKSNNHGQ